MLVRQAELSSEALKILTSGQALALHIPTYHSPEHCEQIADSVIQRLHNGYQRIYESNVRAFTETRGNELEQRRYLDDPASVMATVRASCLPLASPVDRLRCELDELWPGGARLLRLDSQALVFGMVRVWRKGSQALPHLDVLQHSVPNLRHHETFDEQIGVNIYLRMPQDLEGKEGTLEMWNLGLPDEKSIGSAKWGTYGYRRELLPDPDVSIRPEAGDLIMLRTTRLHAVHPTRTGERISLSGFMGHSSPQAPLRLWS
ncbi:2OG-Fe(II) oxygenase [Streptomyces sp. NPDC051773]|uniref:2OG-Fe(II) oxygenase n=1 Tax=Streptomyces sp. NPDC051773 TaxID=3156682 RepID=UPI00343E237A